MNNPLELVLGNVYKYGHRSTQLVEGQVGTIILQKAV